MLDEFEHVIENFTLVPSDGGRFEFSVDGELLYSKLETRRHAEEGEIANLFRTYVDQ